MNQSTLSCFAKGVIASLESHPEEWGGTWSFYGMLILNGVFLDLRKDHLTCDELTPFECAEVWKVVQRVGEPFRLEEERKMVRFKAERNAFFEQLGCPKETT